MDCQQYVLHHVLDIVARYADTGEAAPHDSSQKARKVFEQLSVRRFIARNRGAHQLRPFRVSSLSVQITPSLSFAGGQ
jgi:hypothetical protein